MNFKEIQFNIFAGVFGPYWYAFKRCGLGAYAVGCLILVSTLLFGFIPYVGYPLGVLLPAVFNALYGQQICDSMLESKRAKLENKGVDDDKIESKLTPKFSRVILYAFLMSIILWIIIVLTLLICAIIGVSIFEVLIKSALGGALG